MKEKWHFSQNVIEETFSLYRKMCTKEKESMYKKRKFSIFKKDLIAASFYYSLIKHKCPHYPEEIVEIFQLKNAKHLFRLSEYCDDIYIPHIIDFFPQLLYIFDITYKESHLLILFSENVKSFLQSLHPKTAITIIFYYFLQFVKKEKYPLRKICQICGACYCNVNKIVSVENNLKSAVELFFSENMII